MVDQANQAKNFKGTLNLPHTDFPIHPNHKEDDPALLARWSKEKLFKKSYEFNQSKEKFILHDGPPYANGNIHLGHAYNKILKDIITKAYRMVGYHVPVKPGWDCHGLPIELKVVQQNPDLDRVALKKSCREYANHWIGIQKESFKSLGVLMNWDNPYITMDPVYEATIMRAFGVLVQRGFIERKNKTVPWCAYDQTVLAAAEIEYKDRKDPSIYVLFDLKQDDVKKLFPNILGSISLVIWTTTPWTLPLNRAVLVHPNAKYVLLDINGKYVIVGEQVADRLLEKLGYEKNIIEIFDSSYLENLFVKHPFIDEEVPLIFDESVQTDDGTAFVHCAPGVGPIDYEIGVKNNLEIFSPITADGKYNEFVVPQELKGMFYADGQIWVIKKLSELGKLLYKTTINHSYPHCWRCLNGLIFRATPQWFFNLDREGIKKQALSAVEKINFIPERGRNFLRATVESRWEWCLSRQRVWGVPIPALLCEHCDYAHLTIEIVEKVAQGVLKEGIEFWDKVSLEELIGNSFICPVCKCTDFKKEQDILDVWFDAGISHYAVLNNNPELQFPADIYLEGVDQHRGWFQSSLLTSLVLEKEAAMKCIMTHGYTVDAQGQKMSKSRGNIVEPRDIISQFGTDVLRLWVASIDHDSDPVVSDILLQNVSQVYRKIRNTCRFLLSNLYDFDFKKDAVASNDLLPIDYYALTELELLNSQIINFYLKGDFTAVFHNLSDFCAVKMSSFYLDIVKDRLYVEKSNGFKRRSAQTVLWYILDTITRLMAPIMSFTAELVSDHYQKKDKNESIHLQSFVNPKDLHDLCYGKEELSCFSYQTLLVNLKYDLDKHQKPSYHTLQWNLLKDIRSAILKLMEIEREKGSIKHSLEAGLKVYFDLNNPKLELLKDYLDYLKKKNIDVEEFFKELLIVSQWDFATGYTELNETNIKGVFVKVFKAEGVKCPRCWQWDKSNHPDNLCFRCQEILK